MHEREKNKRKTSIYIRKKETPLGKTFQKEKKTKTIYITHKQGTIKKVEYAFLNGFVLQKRKRIQISLHIGKRPEVPNLKTNNWEIKAWKGIKAISRHKILICPHLAHIKKMTTINKAESSIFKILCIHQLSPSLMFLYKLDDI
jgi:hypothetical protein